MEQFNSEIIFIGSGSSSGTPRVACIAKKEITCEVCKDSVNPGSKNKRRNPSIMIRYKKKWNIVIDCGKTFREAMLDLILQHKISVIDAVLLTHSHADACYGLDDLRDFGPDNKPFPVYVRNTDFATIQGAFPYLVDISKATSSGYVAKLDFSQFDASSPLNIFGLSIIPLVVAHGPSTSLGFKFGKVVYISDVSSISEEIRTLYSKDGVDLLIIDALRVSASNVGHFSLVEALVEVKKVRPTKTLLIGMAHEFHYQMMNEKLRQDLELDNLDVQLSHDGLLVPINLP